MSLRLSLISCTGLSVPARALVHSNWNLGASQEMHPLPWGAPVSSNRVRIVTPSNYAAGERLRNGGLVHIRAIRAQATAMS